MRLFLIDYDHVETLDDIREGYEKFLTFEEKSEESFEDYLEECLGYNGVAVEILTPDTPKGREKWCVSRFAVISPDYPDDDSDWEWLEPYMQEIRIKQGYTLVPKPIPAPNRGW